MRAAHRSELATLILYPLFLGMAPVLGKMALIGAADPFTVAALRTAASAIILWVVYLIFWRPFIYIYPAGLLGCVVIGTVNGIGSLFYYNGLSYLSASVAQLLNATYLIFVLVLAIAAGQPLSQRTIIRASLAFVAVLLITQGVRGEFSWLGAGLMIGNAILFAGTFILSQRVLYEMPSRTVALYVMTTMAVVVVIARIVYRQEWIAPAPEALWPIVALGVTTALSRLTMFASVKRLGSLQTVLVGITETAVSLILAHILLGDSLTLMQWTGVAIFLFSALLIRRRDFYKRATGEMVNMAGMTFQRISFNRIAFAQAFLREKIDTDVTPEELEMIRLMMEAPPQPEGISLDTRAAR